jgi:hypothetical protein
MQTVAQNIADMVSGLGTVLGLVNKIGSSTVKKDSIWDKILAAGKVLALQGVIGLGLAATGKKDRTDKALAAGLATRPVPGSADTQAQLAAAKLLATQKAQAATQKVITDQKAKQLKLDQQALSLKLAGNTTDMQNIEIQAALQRGQSADVTNVLLLQRAILTGNADQANILAQEVLKANGLVMDVNGNISSLAGAKDPFKDWPTATDSAKSELQKIQDALALLKDKKITIEVATVYSSSGSSTEMSSASSTATNPYTYLPEVSKGAMGIPVPGAPIQSSILVPGGSSSATDLAYAALSANQMPGYNPAMELALNGNRGGSSTPVNVTVVLDNTVVSNAITSVQVDNSASGVNSTFNRSGYFAGISGSS